MPTVENYVQFGVVGGFVWLMLWMYKMVSLLIAEFRRESVECRGERLSLAAAHALERDRDREQREKDREFQATMLRSFQGMILGGKPIHDNDLLIRAPGNHRETAT